MLHFDVYSVCDFDTEEEIGRVTIALDPETTSSFSYYYRTNSGEYKYLIRITNLDLSEVVDLEDRRLWELVRAALNAPDLRCKYNRLGKSKMRAIAHMSPNVTAGSWLSTQLHRFSEDEPTEEGE